MGDYEERSSLSRRMNDEVYNTTCNFGFTRKIRCVWITGSSKYHLPQKKSRSKIFTFQPVIIDMARSSNPSLCIWTGRVPLMKKWHLLDL